MVATLMEIIGKDITLTDHRTGCTYSAVIQDAKESWGKLRIRTSSETLEEVWFEPTRQELDSIP